METTANRNARRGTLNQDKRPQPLTRIKPRRRRDAETGRGLFSLFGGTLPPIMETESGQNDALERP